MGRSRAVDAASFRFHANSEMGPMHAATQPLTAQLSRDGRREPTRERLPVSLRCPGCGRSRVIYTTIRPHLHVSLICQACRGTSTEPVL